MTTESNGQFTSLQAKVAAMVATHKSIHSTIAQHAEAHAKQRYENRARMTTEHNMMKDIPEGGFK
jgi:hypothetical protein